jgi:hypothetical protein
MIWGGGSRDRRAFEQLQAGLGSAEMMCSEMQNVVREPGADRVARETDTPATMASYRRAQRLHCISTFSGRYILGSRGTR